MADGGWPKGGGSRRSTVHRLSSVALVAILPLAFACRTERAEPSRRVLGGLVTLVTAAPAPRLEVDTAVFAVPPDSLMPRNALGAAIRRGRAIALATRDSLHLDRASAMRCASCHLDAGTRQGTLPWVGTYARFPRIGDRGEVLTVHERINRCLRRNMQAPALRPDDPRMEALVSYLAFLSRGIRLGSLVEGQGDDTLRVHAGQFANGRTVWTEQCAGCHGARGEGTARGEPVWGRRSFSARSEMASWATFAGFLRGHTAGGAGRSALSDQQVADVTSFVLRQARGR